MSPLITPKTVSGCRQPHRSRNLTSLVRFAGGSVPKKAGHNRLTMLEVRTGCTSLFRLCVRGASFSGRNGSGESDSGNRVRGASAWPDFLPLIALSGVVPRLW